MKPNTTFQNLIIRTFLILILSIADACTRIKMENNDNKKTHQDFLNLLAENPVEEEYSDHQYKVFDRKNLVKKNKKELNAIYQLFKKKYSNDQGFELKKEDILIDKFDLNNDGNDEIFVKIIDNKFFCFRMYKDCLIGIYDGKYNTIFYDEAYGIKVLNSSSDGYYDIQVYRVNIAKDKIYSWDKDGRYKLNKK